MHRDRAIRVSFKDSEKNSRKALAIVKRGKIKTQNGMIKNLRICHRVKPYFQTSSIFILLPKPNRSSIQR